MSSTVLQKSLESAWLNILCSVLLRIFTFVGNAILLRHVTAEYLGINVRIVLFFETILFLSREHFRKACLTKPKDGQWTSIINLVWLAVPIGAVTAGILSYVWLELLEQPSPNFGDQYGYAICMTAVSALLVLCTEPFYIVGQAYMHVRFRSAVDLTFHLLSQLFSMIVTLTIPEQALYYVALTQLLNACIFLFLHAIYFSFEVKQSQKKDDDLLSIPMKSVQEFLPSPSQGIDQERWSLSVRFFKQGFLKQLLTDGEKYVITWFNLLSFSEQGIFDVVSNLGSIPARLLFSRLEESSHLYFSQTVSRGAEANMREEEAASRHLHTLLRGMLLFGLLICIFGYSYSHLALHIYGGSILTDGVGPLLLRMHCVYILLLAVNGVSECYAFNAMTGTEVSNYNSKMMLMTFIFLLCTWLFAKMFGPSGFIIANCCNFIMRIAHNALVIHKRHLTSNVKPLQNLLPKTNILICLGLSLFVCQMSDMYAYDAGAPLSIRTTFLHLFIGAVMFAVTCVTIVMNEDALRERILRFIYRKQKHS